MYVKVLDITILLKFYIVFRWGGVKSNSNAVC